MELDAKVKARIAALNAEMDSIHFANKLYWQYKNVEEDRQRFGELVDELNALLNERESRFPAPTTQT